jgi:hypothetical protein
MQNNFAVLGFFRDSVFLNFHRKLRKLHAIVEIDPVHEKPKNRRKFLPFLLP